VVRELVDRDRVAAAHEFIVEAGAVALIVKQVYTVSRSSKGHVEQPAFLGKIEALRDWEEGLAEWVDRLLRWESTSALAKPHHDDEVRLQALGRVNCGKEHVQISFLATVLGRHMQRLKLVPERLAND
jgi:hypothetical protein